MLDWFPPFAASNHTRLCLSKFTAALPKFSLVATSHERKKQLTSNEKQLETHGKRETWKDTKKFGALSRDAIDEGRCGSKTLFFVV